jgi:TatD DNase family protein
MISIGAGILNNTKLQEALLRIPNDQLFLETDDSEITILEVYKKVSTLKNLSLSELEEIIEKNFKRIFRL